MRLINQLLNAGIDLNQDDSSIKEKRIFNTFLFGSVVIVLPLSIISLVSGMTNNFAIGTGGIITFFLLYIGSRYGYFKLAKNLFIYLVLIGIYIVTLYNYSILRFNGVENLLFPLLLASTLLFRTRENIFHTILIIASLALFQFVRRSYEGLPFDAEFTIQLALGIMISIAIFILTQIYRFNEKVLQKKLIDQKNVLYALIDHVPVMMSLIDSEKRYKVMNKPYADFFNIQREDVIGTKCEEMLPKQIAIKHKDWCNQAGQGKHVKFNDEIDQKHKKQFFSGKYVPIKDSKGEVEFISQHFVDISDLKQIESSLKEANDAKNKLLSMIAHDIRSPLAMLSSTLELDQKKELSDEEFAFLKDNINDKLHNLIHSLNTLLDWAKFQTEGLKSRKSAFDLHKLLNECIDMHQDFADLKEIEIKLESNVNQQILADPTHLKLVVRNMIHNAVKFSKNSGTVSVTAERRDADVILTISDTGVGMEPELVRSILSGNIQQSVQGTSGETGNGLGLSLSLSLLKLEGLDYSINSIKGKGTQIAIQIPINSKVTDQQQA